MARERTRTRRQPAGVAGLTGRRAARSGAVWGLVFGLYVLASEAGYASTYPNPADRLKLARGLAANAGFGASFGPARRLETVAGFTAWRTMGILTIVGAVWALLLATGALRGEEDAGRWELLLAGTTTRARAARDALLGLAVGPGVLFVIVAAVAVASGRSSRVAIGVRPSLFLVAAMVSPAVVFLAAGVLAAQLSATRRRANALALGALGASYLLRVVADSGPSLSWVHWLTPLGWAEALRPLNGSRPWPLALLFGLASLLAVTAVDVGGRRDLGAAPLGAGDVPRRRGGGPRGAGSLALRLSAGVAAGWLAALVAMGLVLGLVARSAASAITGSTAIEKALARLGAGHRGGADLYLGLAFVVVAAMVTGAACSQVTAARAEESEGRLDHLLARGVSRRRWLLGRMAVALGLALAGGVVAGLAAWSGAATQGPGVGLGDMLEAGLNVVPPALFVAAAGFLAVGVVPRAAGALAYGLLAWSFLVEMVASVVPANRFLLDSSVIAHVRPAPAAPPDAVAAAWLLGLAVVATAGSLWAFERRDLQGA